MKFSIIIPTLDEEKRIEKIISQFEEVGEIYELEIIVSDDGSKDNTVEIAKLAGARVVHHKKKSTIAANRNFGAKHAKGDILVFCDADTLMESPEAFFDIVSEVMQDENIVAGVPTIASLPTERKVEDIRFHTFWNNVIKMSFFTPEPVAGGQCQIIKNSAFREIEGYDENIPHGEDAEIMRRLRKLGRLHHFTNITVYESPRRYRKYGYPKIITMGVSNYLYRKVLRRNYIEEWERVE